MANALVARDHQVEVIFKGARVRSTVGSELDSLVDPSVRYHLLEDYPLGLRDPRQMLTIARFIRVLRSSRPDVINMHEATNTFVPFCMGFARHVPLLLTVHDVSTHPGADSREPARKQTVRDFLRRRAHAVIVHGKSLRREYLSQPGEFCRDVHVVPHGCYTVFGHWARKDHKEIPNSVLFFGRLHQYKGLDYLLQAAAIVERRVPDFKIIIAGEGSDLERRYRELVANPRYVLHRGHLANSRVAEVFQQASLVVLPYIEGSQSGVIRVAYVFGKPVIITDVGSLAESVVDGVTGLVIPPRDVTALASAMVDLLTDDARRRAMGAAARRIAETELSWAKVARKTEPILARCIAAAGRARADGV